MPKSIVQTKAAARAKALRLKADQCDHEQGTQGEAEAVRVWVTWVGKALGRAWLLEWESPKTSGGFK